MHVPAKDCDVRCNIASICCRKPNDWRLLTIIGGGGIILRSAEEKTLRPSIISLNWQAYNFRDT